jgi:hypothetical protein
MTVREYAAALLALPENCLDLQVVREGHDGCFDFVRSPIVDGLPPRDAQYLLLGTPLSPDDVQRVVVVG